MSETMTLLGTEIATTLLPIESLGDLLAALHALDDGGQIPMLRSTAVKLEEFLGKPSSEITLQIMEDCREDFSDFLKARKYERNSVRSYLNYLRILVRKAKELGYTAVRPIPPARRLNCGAILSSACCKQIIAFKAAGSRASRSGSRKGILLMPVVCHIAGS